MLADLKLQDDPSVPNAHGYVSRARPAHKQFGALMGLSGRLADWAHDLGTDRSLPWMGLGLVHDLEAASKVINLPEFALWLLNRDVPLETVEFAAAVARDVPAAGSVFSPQATTLAGSPESRVEVVFVPTIAERENEAIRAVLIETGALAADDTTTPLPDLLRMLLS